MPSKDGHSKQGRIMSTRGEIMPKSVVVPSFLGHGNIRKSELLIWLYHFGGDKRYTAKSLSRHTGIKYRTLLSRLVWYYRRGYLLRKPAEARKRPVYTYKISAKGRWFVLNIIPSAIQKRILKRYQEQVKQEQTSIQAMIQRVLEEQGADLEDDD